MPMERDKHENLLNELLDANIEHSRKTEILQELRNDYTQVITDHDEMTKSNEKLQKDNSDLVISNSQLFRQLGDVNNSPEENEEKEQKEYSETVTIEELEGGND